MLILGLDAASQYNNFGYSIGWLQDGILTIRSADLLDSVRQRDALSVVIAPLVREAASVLVAIDAPLGWPAPMGATLHAHEAGQSLESAKNEMFCRRTDRFVRERIGKKPLDVGADKIALAAYTASEALGRLRTLTGMLMPLAWSPTFAGSAAIEVYPGATLRASGLPDSGYKDTERNVEKRLLVRQAIAAGLQARIPGLGKYVEAQDDVFDACLCLVAAQDFLEGRAMPPPDMQSARKEGWIWVRPLNG